MSDPKEPGQGADEPTSVFPTDDATVVVPGGERPQVSLEKAEPAADEWTSTQSAEQGAYDATQVAPSSYVPPTYEPLSYEPLSYESPAYQSPSYETPSYESPSYLPPVYGAPSTSPAPERPAADPFAAPEPAPSQYPPQNQYPQADPYAQANPYAAANPYPTVNPYAAAPGVPLPPYPVYPGYGRTPSGPQPATGQVSSIICVVISALMTVSCYFTVIGIAPLIVSICALVKSNSVGNLWISGQAEAAQEAADSSRSLALWAWLSMVIGFVVVIVVILVGVAIVANS